MIPFFQSQLIVESDTRPPTMESHCSQNERALAPAEAHGVSVCARQWEPLPGCPVTVFCGIVSPAPTTPVFPFTRQRLEFCLILDNIVLVVM